MTVFARRRLRSGYALLAVLWAMTGIATLILVVSLGARAAVATATNRMDLIRAGWRAEDCIERARAVIGAALATRVVDRRRDPRLWFRLDELLAGAPLVQECPGSVAVIPSGIAIDVNDAPAEQLRRFFRAVHVEALRADSLADALVDWRDHDGSPRASGAEVEWYSLQGRSPSRNGPLGHLNEIGRVRGLDTTVAGEIALDSVRRFLTVEPGRVVLDLAPAPVLASLPGITDEAVARLLERRLRHAEPLSELAALGAELSPASRDSLLGHFAELSMLTSTEPEVWILAASATARDGEVDASSVRTEVEVRLVRAGTRAAIVRRRTRP
jgi:general secretion pathway protein K